jgi:hypothetical protein
MKVRPEDFCIQYWWREGSMPPPYHYEYSICLGPGSAGKIVFYPDYPMEEPPVWTETFSIDDKVFNELYSSVVEKGLFKKRWTDIEDPPVGGSLEWMEVVAERNRVMVPGAIKEAQTVADIYVMVRDLVPAQIWSELMRKRDEYEREYLENTGQDLS